MPHLAKYHSFSILDFTVTLSDFEHNQAHTVWIKLGGLDVKIGKTSKFIKIDLNMGSPKYESYYTV